MTVVEQLLDAVGDDRGSEAADRLCEACVRWYGADAAAISLVFDGVNVGTLGASGPVARTIEELQFTLGEGPCLDSVAGRTPVLVVDLASPDHRRWPAYSPAVLAHDIRGVFAMPVLVAGQYLGALDLFRVAPGTLSGAHLADLIFTDVASRVAKQLLRLAQRFSIREDGAIRLTHDLTQEEIAQLIGASRETVNKVFSDFVQRGWIRLDGPSMLIIESESLARRARWGEGPMSLPATAVDQYSHLSTPSIGLERSRS